MLSLSKTDHSKFRNLRAASMLAAAATFAVLLFHMCVIEPLSGTGFIFTRDNLGLHVNDFVNVYLGGRIALSPEDRLRAYDPAVQMRIQNELISPQHLEKPFYFQYPPVVFPILAPLGLLPIGAAYVTWVGLLTALLTYSLALFLRTCRNWGWVPSLSVAFFALCSSPAANSWKLGQPTLLAAVCYVGYLIALEKRRPALQGLAIALCTFKPHYGLILGLHALCLRQWRTIGFAIVFELVLLATAAATIGLDNVVNYPAILFNAEASSQVVGVEAQVMASARALFAEFFDPASALRYSSLAWLAGTVVACGLVAASAKRDPDCRRWAFAILVCTGVVLSTHAHVHDVLMLSAATVVTRRDSDDAQLPGLFARIWTILLIMYVPLSWVFRGFHYSRGFLIWDTLLLLVAAGALAQAWRRPAIPDSSTTG